MIPHTEKIKKFSKMTYFLLQVMFITLIITGIFEFFAWLVKIEHITALFKFGAFTIALPSFIKNGITFNNSRYIFGFTEVIRTAMTIVIVGMAKKLFKKLRVDGSPFRAYVVADLKTLSIVLLITGLFTGLNSFLAAGIVWLLCIIFDYGCSLQNESNTPL